MIRKFALACLFAGLSWSANAAICSSVPNSFSPGTTILSAQVNTNFSSLVSCVNSGAAANGANADITSLAGTGSGVVVTGTTTNNNAAAGKVGEFISSNIASGSAVSMTAGAATDITSVSLTAGDWDCRGNLVFNSNSNTLTEAQGWISQTSATLPTIPNGGGYGFWSGSTSTLSPTVSIVDTRESLSATTTIYLSGQAASSGATLGYGFIGCRRMR